MINLLLGAPGGGKSYEAVVFHVLPALEKGRKVITNLPLNVSEFEKIHPGCSSLIEIRHQTKAPRPAEQLETQQNTQRVTMTATPWRAIPFWHPDDFADEWRHPEQNFGPLYVIDECHIPLPFRGTLVQVEEWFSLHRHHNADVLLITQSYGKINAAIRDLVQVVYRVRKNVALGSMGSYTRKVQDGLRGEVVNTSIRQYEPKFFNLYKSHTRSTTGAELSANDIRPIWKHWTFIGSALLLTFALGFLVFGDVKSPLSTTTKPATTPATHTPDKPATVQTVLASPHQIKQATPPPPPDPTPPPPSFPPDPLEGKGLHLLGEISDKARTVWFFQISQNGQVVSKLTDADLERAGYKWEGAGNCIGWLTYKPDPSAKTRPVTCDLPQTGVFNRST